MALDRIKYPAIPTIPCNPNIPMVIPRISPNTCFITNKISAISSFVSYD